MFMHSFYHSGDRAINTKEMIQRDLLESMNETQGQRLKRMREAITPRLTQTALAKKVRVAQGQIGNIETDKRGYGLSVVAIANVLGTSPEYLTLETDDPSPKVGVMDRAGELVIADRQPSAAAMTIAQYFDLVPEDRRMETHAAIIQLIITSKIAKAENQPTTDTSPAQSLEKQRG